MLPPSIPPVLGLGEDWGVGRGVQALGVDLAPPLLYLCDKGKPVPTHEPQFPISR